MNADVSSINSAPTIEQRFSSRASNIALWVAQFAVAGILGMTAFVKFFNYTPEGSMALAQALGVGRGTITLIGLVEITAAISILVPRTRAIGGLIAALAMFGALGSHAAVLGWSGDAIAEMWPLALVVLAASLAVVTGRRRELPGIGGIF